MFSPDLKFMIAEKVEEILRDTRHPELPKDGPIQFILHVDGAEHWSWANIRNNTPKNVEIPRDLVRNMTV